jgi:branched-chain amino acid transport system permease protein
MGAHVNAIIVNALTTGSIYGLVGIGFVLVYRATGVVSFAQSGFMIIGALVFGSSLRAGLGLPASLAVATAIVFVVGALCYRVILARLVGGEVFVTAVATVGVATVIEAVCLMEWGPSNISFPQQFSYRNHNLIGLKLTSLAIFTVVVAIAVFAVVLLGLNKTAIGLQMRSVASDSRLAAYLGVNVVVMSVLAWAIAGATGGLAGAVYVLDGGPDPGSVYSLGLAAFPAIILGGFDSIVGALLGGVLIALSQGIVAVYVSSEWQVVVPYLILVFVLLARPQGLFGTREPVRL